MKADMVEPVILADAYHSLPSIDVRRGIAGQRINAAVQCTPQKYPATVHRELRAGDLDLSHAEIDELRIGRAQRADLGIEAHLQTV